MSEMQDRIIEDMLEHNRMLQREIDCANMPTARELINAVLSYSPDTKISIPEGFDLDQRVFVSSWGISIPSPSGV